MKRSRVRNRKPRQTVLHMAVNSRRQSQKKQRIIWGGAGLLVTLVLTGYATHFVMGQVMQRFFYENPDFALQNVEIHNTGSLSRAEIMDWAGLSKGQNVIQINLKAVENRLTQMPYIAGVKVERQLPATLKISIRERMPVAKILPFSPKGNLLAQPVYYIDSGGYVMQPKAGEPLKPLPVITGISIDEVRLGEFTEKKELLSVLNLIRGAGYYGLKSELDLRQLEVQPNGLLVVRTRNRGIIRFRAEHLDQQIKRLQTILNYSQSNQKVIRTVDLTPSRNVPVTFF